MWEYSVKGFWVGYFPNGTLYLQQLMSEGLRLLHVCKNKKKIDFNFFNSTIWKNTYTFKNASMSPTAGIKSRLNGFSLCSKSIVWGVYLRSDRRTQMMQIIIHIEITGEPSLYKYVWRFQLTFLYFQGPRFLLFWLLSLNNPYKRKINNYVPCNVLEKILNFLADVKVFIISWIIGPGRITIIFISRKKARLVAINHTINPSCNKGKLLGVCIITEVSINQRWRLCRVLRLCEQMGTCLHGCLLTGWIQLVC